MTSFRQARRLVSGLFIAVLVAAVFPSVSVAQDPAGPDLSIGAAQYPDADAIILRWEQSWTIGADGAVSRREHQWVKMLSPRAINRFADPRIEFNAEEDEVTVHVAQAHLANGQKQPVPEYGYNIGAAHDVAGWPAYAAWRERIVSFSGIEPGVTLELDYEVKTKAGVLPWASALVRLDDDYPVVQRVVSVTVPTGRPLAYALRTTTKASALEAGKSLPHPALDSDSKPRIEKSPDGDRYTWTVGPCAPSAGEAQSPFWTERSPSLHWSSAPDARAVFGKISAAFTSAVVDDPAIQAFVTESIKDKVGVEEQSRAIVDAFRKRFNLVDSPKAQRGWRCRPAGEVFATNYGSRLEASAVLLVALRQIRPGAASSPWIAVDMQKWFTNTETLPADGDVPVDEAIAGIVVASRADLSMADAVRGYSTDGVGWGDHILFEVSPEGGHNKGPWLIQRRGHDGSALAVTGRIKLAADGKLSGEVKVRAQGAAYSPGGLATAEAQNAWMNKLAGRLVDGAAATQFAIQQLGPDSLTAQVTLATEKTLPAEAGGFLATVAEGSVLLKDLPLPLERSIRRLPVQLTGPVRETLQLEFELPEKATAAIVPSSVQAVSGPWGQIQQEISVAGQIVRLNRTIEIAREVLTPEDFAGLREALRDLQAAGSTTLLYVQ